MAKTNKKTTSWKEKVLIYAATILTTIVPSSSLAQKIAEQHEPKSPKKELLTRHTREIDYQVDTLANPRSLATYSTKNNSITLHYDKDNEPGYTIPEENIAITVIHEQKHRDNKNGGLYSFPVSPDHSYKLDMHDEISANMAELIYLRDKYIRTGDISVFDVSSRFEFYKEAIQKGEIKPGSPYREDFDKDMDLIVNGTTKMWEENFKSRYSTQNSFNAIASDLSGKYAPWHEENYQKALNVAYTIGGVNFNQYRKKDIELDEFGKKQLNYMLLQTYMYMRNQSNEALAERFNLPKYDKKLTLSQYADLVQHALVINNMFVYDKSKADGMSKMAKDYLDGKLTTEDMREKFVKSFDKHKDYQETIKAFLDAINTDYYKQGKRLPKKCKEEYFQQAVESLYTIQFEADGETKTLNLREFLNPNNEVPMTDIPEPKISYFLKAEKNEKQTVKLNDPTYPKWEDEDGKRYSDVLHHQVLDTTKDVIDKPEKSHADEQTFSNSEVIKYMTINHGR